MSIVQFSTNETGKRLTLVTLYLQECLYFDTVYSWLMFPLELIIFIIKGSMLYYTTFGGEIVFVIVLAAVQALRYLPPNEESFWDAPETKAGRCCDSHHLSSCHCWR